ncbi:unnamed protein product [Nezara viridula]|uniref:Uncharacterized protein n=1 Tax=Nezara viridula TaxID=85310 RepID=A0A9P0HQY8_NEZVI|nr:unnamed protein product [Nezara viridula]
MGQVYEDSRRFRRGLSIWKYKTLIVLPFPLVLFMETTLFFSVIMDAVTRPNIDWVDKIGEFCFAINTLIFCLTAYLLMDDMDKLSVSADFCNDTDRDWLLPAASSEVRYQRQQELLRTLHLQALGPFPSAGSADHPPALLLPGVMLLLPVLRIRSTDGIHDECIQCLSISDQAGRNILLDSQR